MKIEKEMAIKIEGDLNVRNNMFKKIYLNGIKTVPKEWLYELTPLSLAIWYMDDGSITQSTHQMRISTESFSYEEHLLIKEYLKNKWNIRADIKRSQSPNKFVLSFKAKERDHIWDQQGG